MTLLELFKLALYHEVRAQLFYQMASEITDGDEARLWFIELAGLEGDHADTLIRQTEKSAIIGDFDARAYLQELQSATSPLFSPDEVATFRDGGLDVILRHAREIEAQARDTYQTLADGADSPELRAYFLYLVAEEQGHYEDVCQIEETLGMATPRP